MKYPPEVQERIDALNSYKENDDLNIFTSLHLYPLGLAYPTGYYEARYFNLIGFNDLLKEKRILGKRDAVMYEGNVIARVSEIWADGSSLIAFRNKIKIFFDSQAIYFCPAEE